jgi:hypothetical protein
MKSITREELKVYFKKVKHFRLPQDFDEVEFEKYNYFGWIDESDNVCYLLTELNGKVEAIRGEINRNSSTRVMKHLCSICHQQRELNEVMLFSARVKKLPKGVDYLTRGVYICSDFEICNKEMKDNQQMEKFFKSILFS